MLHGHGLCKLGFAMALEFFGSAFIQLQGIDEGKLNALGNSSPCVLCVPCRNSMLELPFVCCEEAVHVCVQLIGEYTSACRPFDVGLRPRVCTFYLHQLTLHLFQLRVKVLAQRSRERSHQRVCDEELAASRGWATRPTGKLRIRPQKEEAAC